MPGGRPQLPLNTYGEITVTREDRAPTKTGKPREAYRARARYRDSDGITRPVARYGSTQKAAKDALRTALAERQRDSESDSITSRTTVANLADAWLTADHTWRPGTREQHRRAVENHIKPQLGGVRLYEIRTSRIDRVISDVRRDNGVGAAESVKKALSGMFKMAVLNDAMQANPALGTSALVKPRRSPRALTLEEETELRDLLRSSTRATEGSNGLDLADLVEFMLATGARIGETCAARTASLDLEAGTWEINATVVRERGVGLYIQEWPKTAAGWRRIALPPYAVAMLRRRANEERLGPEGIVFGNPHGRALRDPSNATNDLREVLDSLNCDHCERTGYVLDPNDRQGFARNEKGWRIACRRGPFSWVTSHVFRKTVATRLDEAGLSGRDIANQLGHAKPSMTLDVYMGRKVVSSEVARVLDR